MMRIWRARRRTRTVVRLVCLMLLSALAFFLIWPSMDQDDDASLRARAVRIHVRQMNSAWEKTRGVGSIDPNQSKYALDYEMHRDVLVELGYFDRRAFVLNHVEVPSLESKRMWEELLATFPDHRHAKMAGYEASTVDMVVVWDRPDRMPHWAEIVRAHDMPAKNVLLTTDMSPANGYNDFVGTWLNPEGNEVYRILDVHDGGLRIECPGSEKLTIILKRVRSEPGSILFDQYHVMPTSDGYKTTGSGQGHHPFSGIRCMIELSLVDGDTMEYSISTIHTPEPMIQMLHRNR